MGQYPVKINHEVIQFTLIKGTVGMKPAESG